MPQFTAMYLTSKSTRARSKMAPSSMAWAIVLFTISLEPALENITKYFVIAFFTTLKLAEDLLADKIYLCGTIRANRQGYPKELGPKQPAVKRLKQGESMFLRKNNIVATVWKRQTFSELSE